VRRVAHTARAAPAVARQVVELDLSNIGRPVKRVEAEGVFPVIETKSMAQARLGGLSGRSHRESQASF
jgi:hypothetical protein